VRISAEQARQTRIALVMDRDELRFDPAGRRVGFRDLSLTTPADVRSPLTRAVRFGTRPSRRPFGRGGLAPWIAAVFPHGRVR
jgi:hypothetical protein